MLKVFDEKVKGEQTCVAVGSEDAMLQRGAAFVCLAEEHFAPEQHKEQESRSSFHVRDARARARTAGSRPPELVQEFLRWKS